MFTVAVFFGKDATAVFLHVEAELAGFILPLAEADAEIAVDKFRARLGGEMLADFFDFFMLLIR